MSDRGRCSRCVMDVSAKEITFDEVGVCNFCYQAQEALAQAEAEKTNLWRVILGARERGMGKEYNVLIGLSGGVDSSYLLHCAVKMGLRPLCFTVDTGYNKPEADENILKLVEALKVPFYRYTIDLQRFKELQAAFIKSGVKNIEIPTDHILMATSLEVASEYGIKTILSGGNVATESIMPPSWGYNARDLTHIKDIFSKHGDGQPIGLPTCSIWKWNYYRWVKRIKTVYLLDYLEYNREEAEKMLTTMYGFKSTGEKHEENYFTWWFQNYYLFVKFSIDKRKAHYSSMINSGQMKREDALQKLTMSPVYPQLGIEKKMMRYRAGEHENYKMDKWYGRIARLVKLCGF